MNIKTFWILIDGTYKASNGDIDLQLQLISHDLSQLSAEDIAGFMELFEAMKDKAYRADLWDAANIIACGCSEDVFDGEFIGWLITQGETIFENAIHDPDSLAGIVNTREEIIDGRIIDVVRGVYQQKTGLEDIPPLGNRSEPRKLIGELKDEIDMSQFPQLQAKFGDCDDYNGNAP